MSHAQGGFLQQCPISLETHALTFTIYNSILSISHSVYNISVTLRFIFYILNLSPILYILCAEHSAPSVPYPWRPSGLYPLISRSIFRAQLSLGFTSHLNILFTPSRHHAITPSRHHAITPSRHHAITPSSHHAITTSSQNSINRRIYNYFKKNIK